MPAINTIAIHNAKKVFDTIQKASKETKKAILNKAEKLDVYEVAALWISNR
jgi:hypothetical protein